MDSGSATSRSLGQAQHERVVEWRRGMKARSLGGPRDDRQDGRVGDADLGKARGARAEK